MEIPVVSRIYLTGAFLTTAACAVEIVTPFSLYFNWDLIVQKGQVWRLLTTYVSLIPVFGFLFLMHTYSHWCLILHSYSLESSALNFCFTCTFWYVQVLFYFGPNVDAICSGTAALTNQPNRPTSSVNVQPTFGGRRFQRQNGRLCFNARFWHCFHDIGCLLHWSSISWFCLDVYDGLCLGAAKWGCQDVHFRIFHISCSIPSLGLAHFFSVNWQCRNYGFDRYCGGPYLFLFGIRISSIGWSEGMASKAHYETTTWVAVDMWRFYWGASSPSRRAPSSRLEGHAIQQGNYSVSQVPARSE